jgi:hypothetical protein
MRSIELSRDEAEFIVEACEHDGSSQWFPLQDGLRKQWGMRPRSVGLPEIKTQFTFGEYIYNLVIKPDYCGASYTCGKPLPGEDWLRGGDLRDGKPQDLPAVLEDILEHATKTGKWVGR